MSLFSAFRPAPVIAEIGDADLVKKNYKYWRLRTFYAMWVGYAFFYFTRKSFTFAMPFMQSELGLGKFELGLLGSILYIVYGASKFVSGMIGDRSNARYFMSTGLILTGVCNILFGWSSLFWALALFWGLNGFFQGWGWPGCAKLLTHWYSHSERGRWWSFWNTSHNIGGYLIPLVVAACAEYYGWRSAMYIPGVICILGGFFIMNRLRDTPQSLGLPPIEKFREDYANKKNVIESDISIKQMLFDYILNNRFIWLLAISYFLIYIIRTAVNDWSMLYLIEVKSYSALQAGICVSWFDIGGFFGSLVAGWASDVIFKGKRNPISVLFTVGVLVLFVGFRFLPISTPLIDGIFIFLFGFFIFGPQMLIGMAAAELSHKKAAATATGFVGCFAYLGAAVSGAPLGAVTKEWGWDIYLLTLGLCSVLGILFLMPLWNAKANMKEERVPQKA